MTHSLVVGIAGGSGSGKTTVARAIAQALPPSDVTLLEHDAYYRHRPELTAEERDRINFDHPDALETSLLVSHLRALRAGQGVDVPVYDFTAHLRRPQPRRVSATRVVIVEGILTLVDPALREELDIKIYVDTDADIRVLRRIDRDITERGRSFASVCEQYLTTVRPMHLEFVAASSRWADLIIPEGGRNRVAMELVVGRLRNFLDCCGVP